MRERPPIKGGFGRIKTTGGRTKTRDRGLDRLGWMFTLTAAAYNLARLPKLLAWARAPLAVRRSSEIYQV